MKQDGKTTTVILASAFLMALGIGSSAFAAPDRPAGQASTSGADAVARQRALDLEHDMVQSDGVNHPRQVVGKDSEKKASAKPAAAAKKTQRDLDLEHDMMQSDGVNHPREKADGRAPASATQTAAAQGRNKTQRDLDHEHERMLSDGTYHPREIVKK